MRQAFVVAALTILTGCTGSAAQYYEAVQRAAEAQQATYAARYEALADIAAKSGSVEATAAATMAIALSQPQHIQPQYIEHPGLKWAQVLMPSAVALGGMWMQADSAKYIANANRDVSVAQAAANRDIQLGQQQVMQTLGGIPVQIVDTITQGQTQIVDTVVDGFQPVIVPVEVVEQPAPVIVPIEVVEQPEPVIVPTPDPIIVPVPSP